ncbi:LacI family DNA-binding transcriptional regulator [Leucobacter celer]|jgi:LacI family transcriptional regulator|uniref:LacI family DNA-binding transcriptional regulator n=1 Tax=Leucobacter celer TaxID=668625 RepID=UPI0006A771F6|nr:LacI family DNA-binding transcriptional regulator [Leucobacter celer]
MEFKDPTDGRRSDSVTLGDVAAHANVSLTTASRVLGDSSHPVSQKTRDRVLQAASELGYSASPLARALASKRSRIIGVIVPDNVDSYFAEIARGIDDIANEAGYLTIICNAERDSRREIDHIQMLRTYNAAGVVFAGSGTHLHDEDAERLARTVDTVRSEGMVVISLATRDFACDVVSYDNVEASRALAQYLIQLGHREIAFIDGTAGVYSAEQRREGYEIAMRQAALEPRIIPGNFDSDSGTNAAIALLSQGQLPDAVIGANDQTAVGAMTALRHAGLQIPDDVSIAGIGGTRLAALVDLTTAAAPLYELGATAATRVISPEEAGPVEPVLLPHRVIVRQTAGRKAPRSNGAIP